MSALREGLHLTEFPDGPSQPTSQVCGAILFSLALSDQVFARLLPIPSQVSELLQHAISIPQHADPTRLTWPTSEPPGENLPSLSFNTTNLRPYNTDCLLARGQTGPGPDILPVLELLFVPPELPSDSFS